MAPWPSNGQQSRATRQLAWPRDAWDRPTWSLGDAHRRALLSDPASFSVAWQDGVLQHTLHLGQHIRLLVQAFIDVVKDLPPQKKKH